MTERRRQLLFAYRDTLLVAYGITLLMLPFSPTKAPVRLAILFVISGLIFGTCFFVLTTIRPGIRLRSFALNVLVQAFLMALTVAFATGLDIWMSMALFAGSSPLAPNVLRDVGSLLNPKFLGIVLLAGTVCSGVINAVFAIDQKLGPGILWSWVTGKYYNPKEEERIFMFLDMKSSATIAEKLGSLRFSALVRDFFQDLTYPILQTHGEVSHYIGDEAVLTWRPGKGLNMGNCIRMFFLMREAVEARREHYLSSYGLVPEFKAGIHIGPVVATAVGEVKSEIVFHGDTLNTAARIQGLCNSENRSLLLSGELASRLGAVEGFQFEHLGVRELKGRVAEVEILAVTANPE